MRAAGPGRLALDQQLRKKKARERRNNHWNHIRERSGRMEVIEKAIDNAYAAQIMTLYKVLAQGILNAKGDVQKKSKAEKKFKKGLELATEVRNSARAAADL